MTVLPRLPVVHGRPDYPMKFMRTVDCIVSGVMYTVVFFRDGSTTCTVWGERKRTTSQCYQPR